MAGLAGGAPGAGRLSLDDLIALNDEIAALARAGLPLERGLLTVGGDLSGRRRGVMVALGERMTAGASLPEALEAERGQFPTVYRAVVEAGLRAGRLPAALESLATFARGYDEARRAIGLALWYPLLVLLAAYGLLVAMLTMVMPRFLAAFETLRLPIPTALRLLERAGETAPWWGPVLPILVVAGFAWWAATGGARAMGANRGRSPLRWFPWMGSMLSQFEAANFAELLAMLIEHGVPLPEAAELAAEASGDASLARCGRELAASSARGDPPREALAAPPALPPLLRWLLTTGQRQAELASALRQVAATYRKRAAHQAEKIRVLLPTVLLLAIGASAALAYALTLFVPFASALRGLATP
jgi:type II secretory pathway component PulF